mgnify:CR=1 FL=1
MSYIARHNATSIGDGVSAAARVGKHEMLVKFPFLTQLALEGRVWMAGHGLEETSTDGIITTLDETTPTFMLMAPASGTVVLPIWAEFRMHTEGGAAPDAYLSYVGVDRSSGPTKTELDKIPVGRLAANAVTASAICAKTITTVTAITSAQTVLLARRAEVLDNLISVEAATTRAQIETFGFDPLALSFDFWARFHGAFTLYQGQSIMFHTKTATTVSAYGVSFLWAELPASVYVP